MLAFLKKHLLYSMQKHTQFHPISPADACQTVNSQDTCTANYILYIYKYVTLFSN